MASTSATELTALAEWITNAPEGHFARKQIEAETMFRRIGITFGMIGGLISLYFLVWWATGHALRVRLREELARAGFDIRRVTYRSEADQLPGTVLDQWPPAGSRIPQGGSIELVAASRG